MAIAGNIGAELNLLCRKGHVLGPLDITWTDEFDTPVDISSATFDVPVYASETNLSLLGTMAITLLSGPQGKFRIGMDTSVLPIRIPAFYRVSIVIGGEKYPLLYGKLEARA